MPSLKHLRDRIKSVENTKKITKTMKMVSAAKVRKARLRCELTRPYAEKIASIVAGIANSMGEGAPEALIGRKNVKTVRLVIFSADRGLCGGFNSSLAKKAEEFINEQEKAGKTVQIFCVGKKVASILKSTHGSKILGVEEDISYNLNYSMAEAISKFHVDCFEKGECDEVQLLYNRFVNMIFQEPVFHSLVPVHPSPLEDKEQSVITSIEFEPEEGEIVKSLLPRNAGAQVYRAMLESDASEQAARTSAMDNATRNAGDMIKKLSLEYNRSRQAAITTELIEIIAGAEAV